MITLRAIHATSRVYEGGIAQPGETYSEYDIHGVSAIRDGRAAPVRQRDYERCLRRVAAAGITLEPDLGAK